MGARAWDDAELTGSLEAHGHETFHVETLRSIQDLDSYNAIVRSEVKDYVIRKAFVHNLLFALIKPKVKKVRLLVVKDAHRVKPPNYHRIRKLSQ